MQGLTNPRQQVAMAPRHFTVAPSIFSNDFITASLRSSCGKTNGWIQRVFPPVENGSPLWPPKGFCLGPWDSHGQTPFGTETARRWGAGQDCAKNLAGTSPNLFIISNQNVFVVRHKNKCVWSSCHSLSLYKLNFNSEVADEFISLISCFLNVWAGSWSWRKTAKAWHDGKWREASLIHIFLLSTWNSELHTWPKERNGIFHYYLHIVFQS